jgi:hypothetical protein
MLYNIAKHKIFTIVTANGITHNDMHRDCNLAFELSADNELHIYTLKNVHYVPSLNYMLILSLRQLLNNGLHIEGIADDLVILYDNQPIFYFVAGKDYNGLYYRYDLRRLGSKHYKKYLL